MNAGDAGAVPDDVVLGAHIRGWRATQPSRECLDRDGGRATGPAVGRLECSSTGRRLLERLLDLAGLEDLEHVVDLDVLVAVEDDPALEALLDLLHIVLEAPQRAYPP